MKLLFAVLLATAAAARLDAAMASTYKTLAAHLLSRQPEQPSGAAHWVAIAGGPGAGKSTLAEEVAKLVNEEAKDEICVVLPMDGFHFARDQLRALDPPDAAAYLPRRGSPWTFDAEGCFECLAKAKRDGEATLPTYSREIQDPVPGGVQLRPHHTLVLVEGNYLLMNGPQHDRGRWMPLDALWDERWFVRCSDAAAQRQRVITRHWESDWREEQDRVWGPGLEGAAKRADANDVLNMELIAPTEEYAERVILSL